MISRQDFDSGAEAVRINFMSALPKMINYKKYVQVKVLDIATRQELEDVRDCRVNQGLIRKLAALCKEGMGGSKDAESLYCAAMALGTIVKEYDWGPQYLTPDGLYELATLIYNA